MTSIGSLENSLPLPESTDSPPTKSAAVTAVSAGPAHRPSFDGLRGMGMISVLGFHYEIPGFGLSYLSLDMFLVLSGYLITTLLMRENKKHGSISFRRFWLRRILRLSPLYYLYVAVLATFYALGWADHTPDGSALKYFTRLAFYLSTVGSSPEADDLEVHGVGIGGHLWSLALEEQFYLFWSVCCALLLRRPRLWPLILPIPLMQLAFIAHAPDWPTAAFRPWTRGLSFWAGCGAGLCSGWLANFDRILGQAWVQTLCTAILIAGFVIIAGSSLTPLQVFQYGIPPMLLPIAALCTSLWVNDQTFVSRALSFAPLAYVGKISYGIYIWHQLCWLITAAVLNGRPTAVLQAVAMTLSLAVAAISYKYFEAPFLTLKTRYVRA